MNRDELEEMTKDELRDHAEVLGIKVLALDSKGNMVEKILGEYVELKQPAKKKAPEAAMSPLGALYTLQGELVQAPLYRVKVASNGSDNSDVDLVVNGHNIRVQRNIEVVLMEPYVNALKDASIETDITLNDGTKIQRSSPCYSYSIERI